MQPDEEFLQSLGFDDLKSEYLKEKRRLEGINQREAQLQHDTRLARLRAAFEEERSHMALFNLCVFPFTERGAAYQASGFRFVRAEPLYEKGIPNFDFLLYRQGLAQGPAAIFGECKGRVSRPASVVQETRAKILNLQAHLDYVRINYFHLPPTASINIEFVLAVYSMDAPDIFNEVANSGGGIVVWSAPRAGSDELRLVFPPRVVPHPHTMRHGMNELNDTLQQVQSSRAAFGALPQSSPLLKLQALLEAANLDRRVERGHLISVLQKDMFWMSTEELKRQADNLLDLGCRIGFLTTESGVGVYRVVARGLKKSGLEKALEDKWYDFRLDQLAKKYLTEAITSLQNDFEKKRSLRPTLDKWS